MLISTSHPTCLFQSWDYHITQALAGQALCLLHNSLPRLANTKQIQLIALKEMMRQTKVVVCTPGVTFTEQYVAKLGLERGQDRELYSNHYQILSSE